VSAESGVPTFRGAGGLWKQFRAEDLATPEAFARDPRLVWEWYAWRRTLVAAARPNPGHLALAQGDDLAEPLGVGPGRYGGAAASVFGSPVHVRYGTDVLLTNQKTADNFWLHVGVEGGVLGFSAFLAMIGTALIQPIRALRGSTGSRFSVPAGVVSATAVVCVATVTTMLLEGNTAAFLFWFLLGIGSMAEPEATRTDD